MLWGGFTLVLSEVALSCIMFVNTAKFDDILLRIFSLSFSTEVWHIPPT